MAKIRAKVKPKLNLKSLKTKSTHTPKKSADIPVTKAQFDEFQATIQYSLTSSNIEIKAFRKEFDAKIDKLEAKFDTKIDQLDTKIDQLEARIDARIDQLEARIDARIDQLEAKFDAKFATIEAMLHKILLIVEEQNARNKFVLDGYAQLYDRIEEHKAEVEKRLSNIERQAMQPK